MPGTWQLFHEHLLGTLCEPSTAVGQGTSNSLASGSSLSTGGLVINRSKTNTMSVPKEAGERRTGETLLPTVRDKRLKEHP